ncbi:MAG: hypothetical protein IPM69_04815 [Ignavibacteria bacterium]|nr:hypothetical protein [Ignavibacteria bacterium]
MYNKLTVSFIAITLISCNSNTNFKIGSINSQGGIGRTNSYEHIGSFVVQEANNEITPGPDSLFGAIVPPLVISSYQTVVATSNGTISQLNSSRIEWRTKLDDDAFVCSGMCADVQRNIYCSSSDGHLYSFSSDGKLRFKTTFSDSKNLICSDLLMLTDGIVLADGGGVFTKISVDGKILWSWISSLPTLPTFCADETGSIYAAITHNDYTNSDTLIKISSSGICIWKAVFPSMRILEAPIVYNNRVIVGVISQGNSPEIVECSSQGQIIRTIPLRATPRGLSIAVDGCIYCVGYNSGLGETQSVIQAFSVEGKELWYLKLGCKLSSSILIGTDNIALIGSKGMAIAVYLLHKTGTLDNFLSLDSAPSLLYQPAVAPDGSIVFAGNSIGCLTRVGRKKGLF